MQLRKSKRHFVKPECRIPTELLTISEPQSQEIDVLKQNTRNCRSTDFKAPTFCFLTPCWMEFLKRKKEEKERRPIPLDLNPLRHEWHSPNFLHLSSRPNTFQLQSFRQSTFLNYIKFLRLADFEARKYWNNRSGFAVLEIENAIVWELDLDKSWGHAWRSGNPPPQLR